MLKKHADCVLCGLIEIASTQLGTRLESAIIIGISMGVSVGRDGSMLKVCNRHSKKLTRAMKKINKTVGPLAKTKPTLQ